MLPIPVLNNCIGITSEVRTTHLLSVDVTSWEGSNGAGFTNRLPQQKVMQRTGWSMDVVGCIRTMAEARIYMNAGLVEARVDGRPALIRKDIDWSAFNCRLDWLKEKFADWKKWYDYNNVIIAV